MNSTTVVRGDHFTCAVSRKINDKYYNTSKCSNGCRLHNGRKLNKKTGDNSKYWKFSFSFRVHHNVLQLWLLLFLSLIKCTVASECSFMDGQCTYNIRLAPPRTTAGESDTSEAQCKRLPSEDNMRKSSGTQQSQNDYSEQMTNIVKDFDYMRDDHENRIKKLEHYMMKVLDEKKKSVPAVVVSSLKQKLKQGSSSESGAIEEEDSPNGMIYNEGEDDSLIKKLHAQFVGIRKLNREKSQSLRVINFQLNDTRQKLSDTQESLVSTTEQLLQSEEALNVLQDDKYILQNRLKDKTERLERAEMRLDTVEKRNKATEGQLLTLIRSESNLKEEMYGYIYQLNETLELLEDLRDQYRQLDGDFSRVIDELTLRENELMECYKAKTQSFCGFEDPYICGFSQDNGTDFFDWTRSKGATPSSGTGPELDHTCKSDNGYFMHLEASAKGRGHSAVIRSPMYKGFSEQCIQFYYHMYGRHIGTLNVYTQTKSETGLRSVWRAYGNQGNLWIKARLAIPVNLAKTGYQLVFEGSTESGYQGDIAIDDITVNDGECPIDPHIRPVLVPDINTTPSPHNRTTLKAIKKRRRKRPRNIRRRNNTHRSV